MSSRGLPGSGASSSLLMGRRSVGRETALFYTISRLRCPTELGRETLQGLAILIPY